MQNTTTTTTTQVHPSNAAQFAAWNGDEGDYWTAHAERFDRVVTGYDQHLMGAAAIALDSRVLDVGCGTGELTRLVARRAAAGRTCGVDLSASMIEHARHRAAAEGIVNVDFEQADVQVHDFAAGAFDVAISRTGTMFFGEPVVAFANIARALRPGGRLVMLTWRSLADNEWLRELFGALAAGRDLAPPPADAPGPFALADPDRVRAILRDAGYGSVELRPVEADVWFGDDPDDAVHFVLGLMGWMIHDADDATRARALANLHATAVAHHSAAGVTFQSAGWIITATRP